MTHLAHATRIHIIGGAGSGKTTLARQLSAHLAAPSYHLDEIAYEGGFGAKIGLDARLASLEAIIVQPAWVTEGVYLWWTAGLMDAADVIVWLDMPFYLNGWRIVARHFRLSWAGTNRHPGFAKMLRFLLHVMGKQLRPTLITPTAPDDDAATTRIATAHFLQRYTAKTIRCTRPGDVARFRADFFLQP